jgi:hypothetical protein
MYPVFAQNGKLAADDEYSDLTSTLRVCATRSWPRVLIALGTFTWTGCTSYFTDATKLSCVLTHEHVPGRIQLTAKVTNRSRSVVSFFDHPDFVSFGILGTDPSKHQGFGGRLVSYNPPTREEVRVVRPGESLEFQETFSFRRLSAGKVRVRPAYGSADSYVDIRGSHLRAEFSYGADRSFFPPFAWLLGRNFACHPEALAQPDLGGTHILSAAKVIPAP